MSSEAKDSVVGGATYRGANRTSMPLEKKSQLSVKEKALSGSTMTSAHEPEPIHGEPQMYSGVMPAPDNYEQYQQRHSGYGPDAFLNPHCNNSQEQSHELDYIRAGDVTPQHPSFRDSTVQSGNVAPLVSGSEKSSIEALSRGPSTKSEHGQIVNSSSSQENVDMPKRSPTQKYVFDQYNPYAQSPPHSPVPIFEDGAHATSANVAIYSPPQSPSRNNSESRSRGDRTSGTSSIYSQRHSKANWDSIESQRELADLNDRKKENRKSAFEEGLEREKRRRSSFFSGEKEKDKDRRAFGVSHNF